MPIDVFKTTGDDTQFATKCITNGTMMKKFLLALCLTCLAFLGGCAGPKVSSISINDSGPKPIVKAIAMNPGGGLMSDAVATELSNKGFTVIDSAATSNLMVRLNLNEIEIARPEGLQKFKAKGIDALLTVKAAASQFDGLPDSATARMVDTNTGKVLAAVNWQNGWAGAAGSPASRMMRSGLQEAASEMANALALRIQQ